ncbi:peptidoglycan-binding domain-containing protein [Actinokineospora iranica]|uniref:Peptidoglycan-binding (PGRP) domain of peptidoglycan hydrolases-containing protein n=1 Tax=Actinokineospora iranica TaxID=1271860 RepID=A0A1G6NXY2_9PSEU|nr:peptidoglycan-binding protein [Actinokineospora iranica]SDC72802.1 Peptidoglycan-binding (PGRP) domain of peptidoglycan hydrolases-containing protein [Actinokineospora iranica]
MAYRLARALAVFRDEVNTRWPNRDHASDGWIGDAAHATRNSDHNPWVKDGAGVGVVRAFDVDSGPGGDTEIGLWVAEHVRTLGRAGHPALGNGSYVISARRIASPKSGWAWRAYTGSNPHVSHTHVSVSLAAGGYDSGQGWGIAGGGGPTPPPPSPNPGGRPTIRQGSRGDAVREAQQRLAAHGFDPGRADGAFGPRTREATRRFQSARGLTADGVIGPNTWGALLAAPPAAAPAPRPTIRRGAKGDLVREAQNLLNARLPNLPPLNVDGDFGRATEARVKDAQRAFGLAADGVIGPATWPRLLGG